MSLFQKNIDTNEDDKQAFSETFKGLFLRYYDRLLYFSWQFLHDKETANDLVQEAFLNYWNSGPDSVFSEIQARNFLYLNVRNLCLKYIRHSKVVEKHRRHLDDDPVEEYNVVNKIVRAEVLGEIYNALKTLPESCRKISTMSYLEGKKNQEIADELGISINTVKTQKQRALQLLRLRLNPQTFLTLILIFPDF
ncbi:ECF RNA polymerase sigma factor SigE [compost metagenome]|jgi:RNA polymerase sigma-70 factor (family 1)